MSAGAEELVCRWMEVLTGEFVLKPGLVSHLKNFYPSHQIFGHMYETLNVDKKIN